MFKSRLGIGLLLVASTAVLVFIIFRVGSNSFVQNDSDTRRPPADDPIDVALDLSNGWLQNRTATTSVSLAEYLASTTKVTETGKAALLSAAAAEPALDVIYCQPTAPERIGAKLIYENETGAQVMVLARGETKTPDQAIITMIAGDGEWLIDSIVCSAGEMGVVGEYDFEQEGSLLKDSVPPPLDTSFWYLVYEQGGVKGYTAKLHFTATSTCVMDGQESICDPAQFTEARAAFVQAGMTEDGAIVERLELR